MNTLFSTISGGAGQSATLEDVLTRITNATTTNNLLSLATYLRTSTKESTLASLLPGQNGQDPLALLDPGVNTLGFLYILTARLATHNAPPISLAVVLSFTRNLDPAQAQLAPERMTLLAKLIWRRSEHANDPASAITPLKQILAKYPQNRSLTPIHPIFLMACVVASTPTQALPLLSNPITAVHQASLPPKEAKEIPDHALTYFDVLTYNYLGGILLAMLKKWRLAEEHFEICATAPTQSPYCASALQMEALKKLVLVQLIAYGKPSPAPKYMPQGLSRTFKTTPYASLVKTYPARVVITERDQRTFQSDGNWGLVQQAMDKAVRWRMKDLTDTYVALGLDELCDLVSVPPSEGRSILLSMIEEEEIQASISLTPETQAEIVTFSETSGKITSGPELLALLESAQRQADHLAQLERELSKNKDFLTKALKGGREDYPEEGMDVYSNRGPDWDEMAF